MDTSRAVAGSRVTSSSPIKMRPLVAISSPAIMRSVVVLPQPEGPSSVTRVPDGKSSDTSFTAVTLLP